MNIRAKIALALALPLAAMAAGISASWYFREARQLRSSMEARQRAQLGMWAAVCREARLGQNDLALLSYLSVLKRSPGLSYAYLATSSGEIAAHTDSRFILRPLQEWLKRTAPEEALIYESPLGPEAGGARAVLGFSRRHAEEELALAFRRALRDVLQVAGAALLFGMLLAWRISSYLARQILSLYWAAERLGAGDFSTRVPVLSADELGGLARRFNEMARMLAGLNQLKDSLILNVSHDLRSPLAAITMYASYLLEIERHELTPKQARMLEMIKSSGQQLAVFINNLLDLARIEEGKMRYRIEPLRLESSVSAACQLLQVTADLRKVSLSASLPPGLPPVLADKDRLEQVLLNLLSNALKFTPDGGSVAVLAQPAEGCLRVSVADTGPGIAPEDLARIFERFEQSDSEGKKSMKISGSGLGLSLVRETVERHGGRVWVESEPGHGSTFHFTLPVAPQEAPTAREPALEARHG